MISNLLYSSSPVRPPPGSQGERKNGVVRQREGVSKEHMRPELDSMIYNEAYTGKRVLAPRTTNGTPHNVYSSATDTDDYEYIEQYL